MAVTYYGLGGQRRIHEIIFAGSHDASITSGKSNAQTQDLDIAQQAEAGVRLFDLRILAMGEKSSASMVGYHGSPKQAKTHNMHSSHTHSNHDVQLSKGMKSGTAGLKLSNMLMQARGFVTRGDSKEFLILKFDKCKNWQLIAEYCVNLLGESIYKDTGVEFSKLTLNDLSRKVVCVFNESAMREISLKPKDGILGFRSLKSQSGPARAYDPKYKGMQYFGKGGTSPYKILKTQSGKMNENFEKQHKLMLQMANADDLQSPNVLGMMYWTATGATSSIRKRDAVLWGETGVPKMKELWNNGLEASISHQLELERIRCLEWGGKMRIKVFFPNVIMMDFANAGRCETVYKLNRVKDEKLAKAYSSYVGLDS